ncbi:ATP-binding cassette domain-containing protein, partial [Dialister invisus]|uniref:ATP-binding cassette domain-containing protein n=1 Tax=Dialister invisus TaxID=218538 RepID=UPI003AB449DC
MRLEAEQVTKQYQMDPKKARFAYALSRTDLVVESGEFAVITGKSGSGKSTLLHILAGLLQPTSGCVLAGGKDLYRMADGELSKFRNENIAVIPQGGGAIYSLTAEENIRLELLPIATGICIPSGLIYVQFSVLSLRMPQRFGFFGFW